MSKIEVKVPSVGESVTEVTLGIILIPEGSYVEEDTSVCELESDKASMEVPAPKSGVISFSKKQGDTLTVGESFATIDTEAKPPENKPSQSNDKKDSSGHISQPTVSSESSEKKGDIPTVCSINSSNTTNERQMRESIDDHIVKTQSLSTSETKELPAKKHITNPSNTSNNEVERKKMPKIRSVIAKRLVGVKNDTAMLTTFNEVDMTAVMKLRSREKDRFLKKHEMKLTFMPFFMKAAAQALVEFREVNAYIDGDEIVYNLNVHMGIAVSTKKGLVVPVIRNINQMNIVEMTREMNNVATKGREGKLSISDMSGGTFTITNGGVFGSMLSTPILNPPQSAILGLHNIVERPVVVNGKIEIKPIMYLALSYDHRIIDGKDSVQFLVRIKELIEDPTLYILGE